VVDHVFKHGDPAAERRGQGTLQPGAVAIWGGGPLACLRLRSRASSGPFPARAAAIATPTPADRPPGQAGAPGTRLRLHLLQISSARAARPGPLRGSPGLH